MRGVALFGVVLAFSGCKKSDVPEKETNQTAFYCFKKGKYGNEFRECSPVREAACDELGCFQRPTAYCFQMTFRSDDKTFSTCTPTADECQRWYSQREAAELERAGPLTEGQRKVFRSLASPTARCVESQPDEHLSSASPKRRQ